MGITTKKDTRYFIEKSRVVHGDKYDYSESVYVGSKVPVRIICPSHGSFYKTPTNHYNGSGCRKCLEKRLLPATEFMTSAKKVHGDRYDYSKAKYLGRHKKIEIICNVHGSFWQEAGSHLLGCGCPACGRKQAAQNTKLRKKDFLEKSRLLHGDKYDYSQVEYNYVHDNVTIICPLHGEFRQSVTGHITGSGCRECGRNLWGSENYFKRNPEMKDIPCTLYLVKMVHEDSGEGFIKVGLTRSSVEQRFKRASCKEYRATPIIEVFGSFYWCSMKEACLLKKYKHHKYTPARKFSGSSECFDVTIKDMLREEYQKFSLPHNEANPVDELESLGLSDEDMLKEAKRRGIVDQSVENISPKKKETSPQQGVQEEEEQVEGTD